MKVAPSAWFHETSLLPADSRGSYVVEFAESAKVERQLERRGPPPQQFLAYDESRPCVSCGQYQGRSLEDNCPL